MDRRAVWAIILMMVIAIVPAFFLKKPPASRGGAAGPLAGKDSATQVGTGAPPSGAASGAPSGPPRAEGQPSAPRDTAAALGEDTVLVSSDLYQYAFSTRGGRLIAAKLPRYKSLAPADSGRIVDLVPPRGSMLGAAVVIGRDTLHLDQWQFTPSATSLTVRGPATLTLNASRGAYHAELAYTFTPADYTIGVSGRLTEVGPNGGLLLVSLGNGLRHTENEGTSGRGTHPQSALVVKKNETERTDFSSLKPGVTESQSGPFEWVAVKSKYFVSGLLAFDSTSGGISGVTATPLATEEKHPTSADVAVTLPVGPNGAFHYTVYAGPLEYDRLRRIGHDFDDVNPYGWPGVRTLIRFFAAPIRWMLVWMHEHLGLAYGVGLIVFGILVRLLLWPLNQKAMRASMQMQSVQPLMKEIQERYKNDPPRLQQEMFKLYKEHNVNPFGGCWPMLVPMPILFALFFVFQNSIELRGTAFLWLPDLSRPDPLYIIPVIMGLSMFALSKVGQMGMEPNPQMKTMLYVMPGMMTFLFLNFASGLNLYYAISNIASIPQQYMLARERMKKNPGQAPAVEVRTRTDSGRNRPKKA
jgi:YidC/Oxa1 family membrane protein insertase